MIVTKIETPFRQFLESLKVPNSPNGKGGTLFSPDEINYLTRNSLASVYEFKQEDETDRKFYEMFVKWLYEEELDFDYKADAIETPNELSGYAGEIALLKTLRREPVSAEGPE